MNQKVKGVCGWSNCNQPSGDMYYCPEHREYFKKYMAQEDVKNAQRLRMRKKRHAARAAAGGICVCRNFDFIPTDENGNCIACGLPRK